MLVYAIPAQAQVQPQPTDDAIVVYGRAIDPIGVASTASKGVVGGGVAWQVGHGMSLTARVRHFGSAPLIKDNRARSRATTLVNLGGYWQSDRCRVGVELPNLFDARDTDITYFHTSRLAGEPSQGVDDYHLHPVEPIQVRLSRRAAI